MCVCGDTLWASMFWYICAFLWHTYMYSSYFCELKIFCMCVCAYFAPCGLTHTFLPNHADSLTKSRLRPFGVETPFWRLISTFWRWKKTFWRWIHPFGVGISSLQKFIDDGRRWGHSGPRVRPLPPGGVEPFGVENTLSALETPFRRLILPFRRWILQIDPKIQCQKAVFGFLALEIASCMAVFICIFLDSRMYQSCLPALESQWKDDRNECMGNRWSWFFGTSPMIWNRL